MDKLVLDDDTKALVLAVRDLLKDLRARGLNDDQIEAAVDALCDDDRATLQTNVSRIKRKLVDKVGRLAADQYAIVRGRDGVYRIAVPRDLVAMLA